MFVVNTSFHLLASISAEFVQWVRECYLPSAQAVGKPLFLKILTDMSPETAAYCVQLEVDNLEAAMTWHDGEGSRLRASLTERFGERAVYFTTCMEIL